MGVARDWRTRMKERQRFWSVSHGFKASFHAHLDVRHFTSTQLSKYGLHICAPMQIVKAHEQVVAQKAHRSVLSRGSTCTQGGRKLADWDRAGADEEDGVGGTEDAELAAAIQLSLAESPVKGVSAGAP